jgi:hypothetical protein
MKSFIKLKSDDKFKRKMNGGSISIDYHILWDSIDPEVQIHLADFVNLFATNKINKVSSEVLVERIHQYFDEIKSIKK